MTSQEVPNSDTGEASVSIGGLPVSAVTIDQAVRQFADYCKSEARQTAARPLYSTSINGQVLSLCWQSPEVRKMFAAAGIIHCDGQPIVMMSRLLGRRALPERVATTDLFPAMAEEAARSGLTFYMLGASEEANRAAVANTLKRHPSLRIVGRRNGYFSPEEEQSVVAEIAALKPDILWVAMGAPAEQEFCVRNLDALKGVGIIKTSGGLFDFVSLAKKRAPSWMQKAGLEWLYRLALEPRRLFLRYLVTNPHAFYVVLRTMR